MLPRYRCSLPGAVISPAGPLWWPPPRALFQVDATEVGRGVNASQAPFQPVSFAADRNDALVCPLPHTAKGQCHDG
jgi:hypothetical protein